ncbi:MAG TPA: SIS domain-containing protein [Mycobacteriales bacterium]|nr:SIS domain-containing protein [Mycobacteriales bacterium]
MTYKPVDEALLDDPQRLAAADPGGMLRAVATSGPQLREAIQLTTEAGVGDPSGGVPPRAAVLVTDGPVAALGDLLWALAGPDAPAPVVTLSGQPLPLWVGPADVLLVVSQTGTDDSTLTTVEMAVRRGVPMLGVGPPGTPLAEAVASRGRSPYVGLPLRGPSRALFWSLATPVLIGAAHAGLIRLTDIDLRAAADALDVAAERCRPGSETFVNAGKALGLELAGSGPAVVWGSTPLAGVAARRLAVQLAGNAGRVAVWGTLPAAAREAGGVLDVPLSAMDDFFRDRVAESALPRPRLVLLRDDLAEDDLSRRYVELARRRAADGGIGVSELIAEGEEPLERLASVLALADFASVYCGLAAGVDPAGVRLGEG